MSEGEPSREKNFTKILIPTSLFEKISERIKGTGFTSVSTYVTYVLKETLTQEKKEEESFSKEDEEKIKARLRALGYIE